MIEDRPRTADDQPRVLSLFGTNDAWYAHRDNSFMGDLLNVLGARNIAADAEAHDRYRSLAPIDIERVVAQDPDVIFIIPYNDAGPDVISSFMAHPAFQSLRAVREGRAHVLDGPIYTSHAGPRAGEALRTLYGYLYPDAAETTATANAERMQ
jgi:iron complex transport system substrate-binding protein